MFSLNIRSESIQEHLHDDALHCSKDSPGFESGLTTHKLLSGSHLESEFSTAQDLRQFTLTGYFSSIPTGDPSLSPPSPHYNTHTHTHTEAPKTPIEKI